MKRVWRRECVECDQEGDDSTKQKDFCGQGSDREQRRDLDHGISSLVVDGG